VFQLCEQTSQKLWLTRQPSLPRTAKSPKSSCSHMMQILWPFESRFSTSNVTRTPRTQAEMLLVSTFMSSPLLLAVGPQSPSTFRCCYFLPSLLLHSNFSLHRTHVLIWSQNYISLELFLTDFFEQKTQWFAFFIFLRKV